MVIIGDLHWGAHGVDLSLETHGLPSLMSWTKAASNRPVASVAMAGLRWAAIDL